MRVFKSNRPNGWRGTLAMLALQLALHTSAHAVDMSEVQARCPDAVKFMEQLAEQKALQASQPLSKAVANPKLRDQLIAMQAEDQKVRESAIQGNVPQADARMERVDVEHLAIVKDIATKYGFPTVAMIGKKGVDAFWLLVQHADSDPAFQLKMLEAIEPRADGGEIDKDKVALLTDRVLIAQGKPQRYGTQFRIGDGELTPQPTEDPQTLDARRAQWELMPLADYTCMLGVMYRRPAASK
jgi:hypothetical protein